jgi:hypothetical protein
MEPAETTTARTDESEHRVKERESQVAFYSRAQTSFAGASVGKFTARLPC